MDLVIEKEEDADVMKLGGMVDVMEMKGGRGRNERWTLKMGGKVVLMKMSGKVDVGMGGKVDVMKKRRKALKMGKEVDVMVSRWVFPRREFPGRDVE